MGTDLSHWLTRPFSSFNRTVPVGLSTFPTGPSTNLVLAKPHTRKFRDVPPRNCARTDHPAVTPELSFRQQCPRHPYYPNFPSNPRSPPNLACHFFPHSFAHHKCLSSLYHIPILNTQHSTLNTQYLFANRSSYLPSNTILYIDLISICHLSLKIVVRTGLSRLTFQRGYVSFKPAFVEPHGHGRPSRSLRLSRVRPKLIPVNFSLSFSRHHQTPILHSFSGSNNTKYLANHAGIIGS